MTHQRRGDDAGSSLTSSSSKQAAVMEVGFGLGVCSSLDGYGLVVAGCGG